MDDNWRTAIGYICIALTFISWLALLGWIAMPTEFTFKIEMDNNTRAAVESVEYPIVNWAEWGAEDWYWDTHNWDKRKNITLEKDNNTVAAYYFYYSNKYGIDSYIGNYKLNGEFNLEDEDDYGKCWSYNGSDESNDWRIVEVEEMIEKRRCVFVEVDE